MKILTVVVKDQASLPAAAKMVERLTITKPVVVSVDEFTKKRTRSQNDMAWAGMLADFAQHGFINGRTFAEPVWHEYLKQLLLPSIYKEGLTLKGYVKWLEMPDGSMRMVGSTTKLTTKGFSDYLESCYAYGCEELNIKFSVNPRDYHG